MQLASLKNIYIHSYDNPDKPDNPYIYTSLQVVGRNTLMSSPLRSNTRFHSPGHNPPGSAASHLLHHLHRRHHRHRHHRPGSEQANRIPVGLLRHPTEEQNRVNRVSRVVTNPIIFVPPTLHANRIDILRSRPNHPGQPLQEGGLVKQE